MITKYEIDFLSVKDADAILIHFVDDVYGERIIAIDAGRYSDGDIVSSFVEKYYKRNYIDIAVCTHCDDDHYGGFVKIIEEQIKYPLTGFKINSLWVNDPGAFVEASDVKYYRSNANVKIEARSVYTLYDGKNLLELAKQAKVPMRDVFSFGGAPWSVYNGAVEILGPTLSYYKTLVPNLRHALEPYKSDEDISDDTSMEYGNCISPKLDAVGDDTSTHNQSSAIIMFSPGDGNKFIFMGDAGRDAFNNMLGSDRNKMQNALVLKVPHHGSKYNMDSTMINFINPTIAVVSAESTEKYFSPLVKNALKRKGVLVYSTMNSGHLWYNHGFEERVGYTSADIM